MLLLLLSFLRQQGAIAGTLRKFSRVYSSKKLHTHRCLQHKHHITKSGVAPADRAGGIRTTPDHAVRFVAEVRKHCGRSIFEVCVVKPDMQRQHALNEERIVAPD